MKKITTLFLKNPNDLSKVSMVIDPNNSWVIDGKGIATIKKDGTSCAIINSKLYKRFDARLKTGKRLKAIGYYINLLEVGQTVVKVSNKKFNDNSRTDEIIGFGKHPITGKNTAILKNNGHIDKRQLRPINIILDSKYYKDIPDCAIPCQEPDLISGHHPHWILCDRNDSINKYHFEAFDKLDNIIDGTYELCGPMIQGNPEKFNSHVLLKHGDEKIELNDISYNGIKEYLYITDIEGIVFHHESGDGRMCKIRKVDYGFRRKC